MAPTRAVPVNRGRTASTASTSTPTTSSSSTTKTAQGPANKKKRIIVALGALVLWAVLWNALGHPIFFLTAMVVTVAMIVADLFLHHTVHLAIYLLGHVAGFALAATWFAPVLAKILLGIDWVVEKIFANIFSWFGIHADPGRFVHWILAVALLVVQLVDVLRDRKFDGWAVWSAVLWPTVMLSIGGRLGHWVQVYGDGIRHWLDTQTNVWVGGGTMAGVALALVIAVIVLRHYFGAGAFRKTWLRLRSSMG